MTVTVAKKMWCDARDCENYKAEEHIGKKGSDTSTYFPMPRDWVRTNFQGGGERELTLHFCCKECMQKEINLLTQGGLEAPDRQRSLLEANPA